MPKVIYPTKINPDKKLPNITARTEVAQSSLFVVEQKNLTFANGNTAIYEAIKGGKGGAVLVVALNNKNEFLLIREYCGGQERYELAFPKGKLEHEETIEEAANRELQEETGFSAKRITFLKNSLYRSGLYGAFDAYFTCPRFALVAS